MASEKTGKVLISAIADEAACERVVAFICANARNTSADAVRNRLTKLPLVLAASIETGKGERLVAALAGLGAEAVFEINEPAAPPATALPPPTAPQSQDAAVDEVPPAPRPPRPRPARKKPVTAAQAAEAEKLRVAGVCRIALAYAIIAALVAMSSPLFFIFSLPLALYAVHRTAVLLETDIWLRIICLSGVFVPVLNILILTLLLIQSHLFIRRSRVPTESIKDELSGLRSMLRFAYAAVMAFFLIGTASGHIPDSLYELRETVEKKLKKAVELSARDFPRKVDKYLRIDRMSAGPGKRLTFHCTMLDIKAGQIDANRFRASINHKVVEKVCSSREMEYFLKNGATVAYAFNGNDGQEIATVSVTNSDCGK